MINNTNVENKYTTNGLLATVYPITFQGATDANGYPTIEVVLTFGATLGNITLEYNADYELVYEEVDETTDESMNVPTLLGIRLLNADHAAYGNKLDIHRSTPLTQEIDFQVGRIDPEQIERSADLSVLRDQELQRKLDITLEIPADHEERIEECENSIGDLQSLVPTQATAQNKLTDQDFVNSSIATSTATFRGTYDSLAELEEVTADENDYGFVRSTDTAGNTLYNRYKYASGEWVFEYALNNSSFTAAQWTAINSGVTPSIVSKVNSLPVLINSVVVNDTTGVISIVASSVITSVAVKTIYGVAIAGTVTTSGSEAVFTPTTANDIIYGNWCLEVA
jgi:hypothetical protein